MRGFTLVEMLVVIVLMLGVAAIVMPLALEDTKRAAFTEAKEQLEAALMSARAEAQRTGRVLRMVAATDGGECTLRVEEVMEAGMLSPGGVRAGDERAQAVRVVVATSLPGGVKLGQSRDAVELAKPGEPANAPPQSGEQDGQDQGSARNETALQLAVFLPDGQIAATTPLYLGGPDGRVGQLGINSWTGALTLTVLPPRREGEEEDKAAGDGSSGSDMGKGGGGGGGSKPEP